MKQIQIFMRHCYYSPNSALPNRHRPKWFDKIKLFENFKKTINPELAEYTIVYDEKFGHIQDTFSQTIQLSTFWKMIICINLVGVKSF